MLREIPSKVRKIAHESVYDKTLRLLMTADQNVEFMEEDEDDGGGCGLTGFVSELLDPGEGSTGRLFGVLGGGRTLR